MEQRNEMIRTIAKFMGWEDSPYHNTPNKMYKDNGKTGVHIDHLNYDTDYNSLMEVVEKIEAMTSDTYYAFTVGITGKYCVINCYEKNRQHGVIYQTPYGFEPETKKQALLLGIVDFIEYCKHWNIELKMRAGIKVSAP